MEGYAKFVNKGTLGDSSGFTFGARTNHDKYGQDGCNAFAYYARLYWATGQISFQKEYYHGSNVVYTPSNRVHYFNGEVPMNRWIGMRFTVVTKGDSVELKLYMEEGGKWVLRHSMVDSPGSWKTSKAIPSQCPQKNGGKLHQYPAAPAGKVPLLTCLRLSRPRPRVAQR